MMEPSTFRQHLLAAFRHEPTTDQVAAFDVFARFLSDADAQTAMILRGSAGTGKTAVAASLVRALCLLRQKVVLMAPTGRAAKVLAQSVRLQADAGERLPQAFTIHRKMYRQQSVDGVFSLNDNLHTDTLFLVDEASMIANDSMGRSPFGSGQLLDDLISYVYGGRGGRLLLVGDAAQLPPVGQLASPALQSDVLSMYGLRVYEADLRQVHRQAQASGILWHANAIRQIIDRDETTLLPPILFDRFADICRVDGQELIDTLGGSYREVGTDETMVVTRSNKRANAYNMGIRNMILDREEELCRGDQLMVVKNKYLSPAPAGSSPSPQPLTFIANGDRVVVERVRHERSLYGFRFADVWLRFPDYDDYELEAVVLLDSLQSEAPALPPERQEALFQAVLEDYAHLPRKADRMKALREDVYFNALQVKYAYAVTCHKAQGGQWAHVYVDKGAMAPETITPDYMHWLYTAFTRATERLYLVNW